MVEGPLLTYAVFSLHPLKACSSLYLGGESLHKPSRKNAKRLTLVSTTSIGRRNPVYWLPHTDENSLCCSRCFYSSHEWLGRAELGELVRWRYLEHGHCLDWLRWRRSVGQCWWCWRLGSEKKLVSHGRIRLRLRWWCRRVTNVKRDSAMSRWRAASRLAVVSKDTKKKKKKKKERKKTLQARNRQKVLLSRKKRRQETWKRIAREG